MTNKWIKVCQIIVQGAIMLDRSASLNVATSKAPAMALAAAKSKAASVAVASTSFARTTTPPKQKPNLSSTEMFQTPRRILRRTVPNTPVLPLHPEPDTPDSDDLGHEPWTPPMNYIRDGVVWQTPRSPTNNCPDSPGSIHHFTSRVETPFRVRHAEFLRQAGWKPMTETSK